MSVNSRKTIFRRHASVLAFILVWMSGVAVLKHTDCCDDYVNVHQGDAHMSAPITCSGPDICAACAWTDAVNIYLPTAIVLPDESAYRFAVWSAEPPRSRGTLVRSMLTRGPPYST